MQLAELITNKEFFQNEGLGLNLSGPYVKIDVRLCFFIHVSWDFVRVVHPSLHLRTISNMLKMVSRKGI